MHDWKAELEKRGFNYYAPLDCWERGGINASFISEFVYFSIPGVLKSPARAEHPSAIDAAIATCEEYLNKEKTMQTIPGVPVGTKIIAVGIPKKGDWFLSDAGSLELAFCDHKYRRCAILGPDNVYGVVDLASVPIPQGYERAGNSVEEWLREPRSADNWFWSPNANEHYTGPVCGVNPKGTKPEGSDKRRIIVRPVKPKTKNVLVVELKIPECWANDVDVSGWHAEFSRYGEVVRCSVEERPA